jgi:hypothetical protein
MTRDIEMILMWIDEQMRHEEFIAQQSPSPGHHEIRYKAMQEIRDGIDGRSFDQHWLVK